MPFSGNCSSFDSCTLKALSDVGSVYGLFKTDLPFRPDHYTCLFVGQTNRLRTRFLELYNNLSIAGVTHFFAEASANEERRKLREKELIAEFHPTGNKPAMTIRRIVADIKSKRLDDSRAFYVDFLGLKVGMDLGWVVTFVSPSNPTAQISVMRDDNPSALAPNVSIEVGDVGEVHARAIERGLQIVYPLTDEPWGIRRFFVLDPNGIIINVSTHLQR